MKTLIVYYSLEGNTKYVADRLAKQLGADTLRLKPVKRYAKRGPAKFVWGGKSVMMNEAPELEPYDADLEKYDRIIIGFPVWASSFAPPIRTFVEENRSWLRVKELYVFACQGGRGAEKAFSKLQKLIGVDYFEEEAIFIEPKKHRSEETDDEIDLFCEEIIALSDDEDENNIVDIEVDPKLLLEKAIVVGKSLKKLAEIAGDVGAKGARAAKTLKSEAGTKSEKIAEVARSVKDEAVPKVAKAAESVKDEAAPKVAKVAESVKSVKAGKTAKSGAAKAGEACPKGCRVREYFSHWNYRKHAKFCTLVYLTLYAFDMTVSYFICKKILDRVDEMEGRKDEE